MNSTEGYIPYITLYLAAILKTKTMHREKEELLKKWRKHQYIYLLISFILVEVAIIMFASWISGTYNIMDYPVLIKVGVSLIEIVVIFRALVLINKIQTNKDLK